MDAHFAHGSILVKQLKPIARKPRPVTAFHKGTFDTVVAADLANLKGGSAEPATFAYCQRQSLALTEKYVSSDTASTAVRWTRGLDKFLRCEAIMKEANQRILTGLDPLTERVLVGARHLIYRWLPPVDDVLLDGMCDKAKFGPGSTVLRKGDDNRLAQKLTSLTSTTPGASAFLTRFYLRNPAWLVRAGRSYPSIVPGDTLFAAPKDAEIDRVCGKQPDFNVLLQLGLWLFVEPYFKRAGLSLRDQSRGWAYALRGSRDGSYATVDLSSASDLISFELVRRLLPPDWFALLSRLRSRAYSYKDSDGREATAHYEKFSAMGNGFTFPLESLIFKALCDAILVECASDLVASATRTVVYGDDIIIPSPCYDTLVAVLRDLGMSPNPKKSFSTGPFRETCGKEYFDGVEIRPWFIDADPVSEVELYILHNTIRVHRWGECFPLTLAYLFSLMPDPCTQPPYYGAGDNWEDWEEWKVREAAFGFMVDNPTVDPTWHPDFQSRWWKLKGWRYYAKPSEVQDEKFFLVLSLYTGDHRVYDFRQGYWKLRSRGISTWL